jgi:PAS domain S-box-containing protein
VILLTQHLMEHGRGLRPHRSIQRELKDLFGNNLAHKQTENEPGELAHRLAEQSRIFDTALSSIPDFAYIFDRNGRFIYVNRALLDLWGLRLEDAVGKNFFDLQYPDELAAKLQRQIQQVIETGQGLADEIPYTSPTGAGGYYEYIFRPVIASDGAIEMVAGSTRDITERRRAEGKFTSNAGPA